MLQIMVTGDHRHLFLLENGKGRGSEEEKRSSPPYGFSDRTELRRDWYASPRMEKHSGALLCFSGCLLSSQPFPACPLLPQASRLHSSVSLALCLTRRRLAGPPRPAPASPDTTTEPRSRGGRKRVQ